MFAELVAEQSEQQEAFKITLSTSLPTFSIKELYSGKFVNLP